MRGMIQCASHMATSRGYPARKRKAHALRAELAALKLAKGCADCGYNQHPDALQFDHLPESSKVNRVSQLVNQGLEARVWKEVAKCEVVCANCHAIRTAVRRNSAQ